MMDSTVQTRIPKVSGEDEHVYYLSIHDNETDHMEEFLKDSAGDPVEALSLYAEFLKSRAQHLEKLAEVIDKEISEGALICIDFDWEDIGLCGDEDALDRIADMKLIERL
jgi:hypothetical protein